MEDSRPWGYPLESTIRLDQVTSHYIQHSFYSLSGRSEARNFYDKIPAGIYLFLLFEGRPFSISIYKASNGWRTNK